MAGEVRFYGSVRFAAEASLELGELSDYVLRVEGRVSGGLGSEGSFVAEEENVGLIEAYVVQTAKLATDGVALGDVCDAHSDQLETAYAALFDEDDEPREELELSDPWATLLHIQWLEVDAPYRESDVLIRTAETLIRSFCPAGIVTACRGALELRPAEWRALGFRKIAGTDVVYRDNGSGDPYDRETEGG